MMASWFRVESIPFYLATMEKSQSRTGLASNPKQTLDD